MVTIRGRPASLMILFAVALHLWWTLMIALDAAALHATGVASLYRYIHHRDVLAAVIGAAAVMALSGLFVRASWMVLLLVPQQVILMMSAAGAIDAMWLAQFADGVIRPRAFIAADQMYSVLAAIGHTMAIIARVRERSYDA